MRDSDIFNKQTDDLLYKKLYLFDMDGTIYRENILFDGTRELLSRISEINGKYVFITNNSSKSVNDYIDKVSGLGIKVDRDNFFTSTQATIVYLKEHYPNELIYCQGTKSFTDELIEAGINVTLRCDNDASVVLVGFDTELTSQKIRNTCEMLRKEVDFIATNPDLACPVEFGFIPDCGSICKMYEDATGRKPIYIGKPNPVMVDFVRDKFGYSAKETVVIGDRLYTDIASGINSSVTSVCVLTGETNINEIEQSNIKPSFTFQSVKDIYEVICGV